MSFGHRIADFGYPNIHSFCLYMQWDEKELNSQFTPNVYFGTPSSEILAKALACSCNRQILTTLGGHSLK